MRSFPHGQQYIHYVNLPQGQSNPVIQNTSPIIQNHHFSSPIIIYQRQSSSAPINPRPESLDIKYLKNKEDFLLFLENFADKDNYYCQICHNFLWQPTNCNKCSKSFCKECISYWLEQCQTCPTCRERFECKKIDKSLICNLHKLSFRCNQFENGCEEYIGYDQLLKHSDQCEYKEISCKNQQCTYKSIRKTFQQHSLICPYFQFKCKWCSQTIKRSEESQHDEICTMKMLTCENQGCEARLARREICLHIKICQYRLVKCEDCALNFREMDLEQHREECNYRVVSCKGCKQNMLKSNVQIHEEICDEIQIVCEGCDQGIEKKNIHLHTEIACLKERLNGMQVERKQQNLVVYNLVNENIVLKKDVENIKNYMNQMYDKMRILIEKNENLL